ncbi:MAG: flagellin [Rhodospirillaceae bacterium]|mgnify:FL=1|nr:flagellin [Rhodospirillaceae bacterium]MBT6306292.1 flagellin [Rhodospirillaceae bacterium]
MAFSVWTNIDTLVALNNFEKSSNTLDKSSKLISTGLKISDSKDDASNFSIAQGIRGEIKALDAIIRGLNNAKGIAKVALAGATAVSNLFQDIRQRVVEGSNPANTSAQQSLMQNDYSNLLQQMRQFMENSTFNDVNILIETNVPFNTIVGAVNDVDVLKDLQGNSLILQGHRLDLSYALLFQEDITTPVNASQTLDVLLQEERRVQSTLATLGADYRSLQHQTGYLENLKNVTEIGLGNIIDADMARASVEYKASQVRKELGSQALNVANQSPQLLLSLFDNE